MPPSDLPVSEVLDRATGPRRAEADELFAIHDGISGEQPAVWAGRIVGFGEYECRYVGAADKAKLPDRPRVTG